MLPLSDNNKNMQIIIKGEWLADDHIEYFHKLLEANTNYKPRESWRIQIPATIQPVPENQDHIQILHQSEKIRTNAGGHWVCSFYKHDERRVYIYDSLNFSKLHSHHKIFLQKLYPFLNKHDGAINEEFIEFPRVQTQPNYRDCGVFAIAFAVSLLFKILPDKVTYNHALMREHLIQMFRSNRIEHFPCIQDQQLTRCMYEHESAIGGTINKNPSYGNYPAFNIGQKNDEECNRKECKSNYHKKRKEEINGKRRAVYKTKKGVCNTKKRRRLSENEKTHTKLL